MKKYLSDYTNEEIESFVESINFEELYQEIRNKVGDDSLQFEMKYERNRIEIINTENLKDKCGIMAVAYNEVRLATFNTSIFVEEESGELAYWCTIHYEYEITNGGSNGITILTAHYKNRKWNFS